MANIFITYFDFLNIGSCSCYFYVLDFRFFWHVRQVSLCFSSKLRFSQNEEKFDLLSHKSVCVYVIKVLNINRLFMKYLSPEDNFCAVTLFSKDIGGLKM